ncbi:HAMP domain-containing sensor histidine kinase [Dyadobacter sp. CY323]|uniref:sensor histidine kinase n=1 Tax=Dyadobacter sp. CY323 TaxID=2907302 RepID=UPI001F3B6EC1|nr:HAMP domain-containing sensor histidine kinase [Dyadobacter sp. CY323]MCE6989730.1 HAMP domain-containing histidine kinase [Dyadobacter sp. CY323]
MAKNKMSPEPTVNSLVNYLRARLETILIDWRIQCEADPKMTSKSSFSREEFNDQMPLLIDLLFRRLAGEPVPTDAMVVASEHGLHRWQSGYALPELIMETEHLFNIIIKEIETFIEKNDQLDAKVLQFIYQQVYEIYGQANRGSVLSYHQLMQNDAAERANSLEFALNQLQQLGQQRGDHLRQSSHDIRASFSILMVASKLLEMPANEKERVELIAMLNRNLSTIREMLLQLTDYARIESGQDTLDIKKFDVAALVRDTIQTAKPLAEQYGLELQGSGPEIMEVESDRVKVQRILTNLLHNALKYTRKGGIYITWGPDNALRWTLSIQDTGPGFSKNSPAALLAEQLKPAVSTTASHQDTPLFQELPNTRSEALKESEGLGLFIVKRLCELMKASMDIESGPEKGTLVRIRFLTRQVPEKN